MFSPYRPIYSNRTIFVLHMIEIITPFTVNLLAKIEAAIFDIYKFQT